MHARVAWVTMVMPLLLSTIAYARGTLHVPPLNSCQVRAVEGTPMSPQGHRKATVYFVQNFVVGAEKVVTGRQILVQNGRLF